MKYVNLHVKTEDFVEHLKSIGRKAEGIDKEKEWTILLFPINGPHSQKATLDREKIISVLNGREYSVEDCQEVKHFFSCGCVKVARWKHFKEYQPKRIRCQTCTGYRSDFPYPVEFLKMCTEHSK